MGAGLKSQEKYQWVYKVGLCCMGAFLVLAHLSMVFYPGGTNADALTEGYLLSQNFFSDLGRYRTFSGESKLFGMVIYVIGVLAASLGMVLYFLHAPKLYDKSQRLLSWCGSVAGVFSGLCFAAVALTPWDIVPDLHGYFVKTAFPAFLVTSLFYTIVTFRSKSTANIYAWTFLSYSAVLLGYLYLLFFGPAANTENGRFIQAFGQKVVIYAQALCLIIQLNWARTTVFQGSELAHS